MCYEYLLITVVAMDSDGPSGIAVVECVTPEHLYDRHQGESLAAILRSLARMSHAGGAL